MERTTSGINDYCISGIVATGSISSNSSSATSDSSSHSYHGIAGPKPAYMSCVLRIIIIKIIIIIIKYSVL